MKFAPLVVLLAVYWVGLANAGDYTVYSWDPQAKVAVRAVSCRTFAEARETAAVLSALHVVDRAPALERDFSMISNSAQPLTTWIVQSAEPFQPHEYFWLGSGKEGSKTQR